LPELSPETLASPPPDRRVVVLGDGTLGLLVTFVLAGFGMDVLLVGHYRSHLEMAERAGARGVLESKLDRERERAPVVVEATGTRGGLAQAVSLTQPRGKVVLKSTVAKRSEIDLAPIVVDELTIVGSRCGDIGYALELLGMRQVNPLPLVSATYPLSEAAQALRVAGQSGILKVLVRGT
jgi:threonine dehydrogenase-like Zn-dependent dehydrogenase